MYKKPFLNLTYKEHDEEEFPKNMMKKKFKLGLCNMIINNSINSPPVYFVKLASMIVDAPVGIHYYH